MTNNEKVQALKALLRDGLVHEDEYYSVLEAVGALKRNYYDYMITEPIDVDEELKRVKCADYALCGALITMLLREDHFSNGSFRERKEKGQVNPIVERLIEIVQNYNITSSHS